MARTSQAKEKNNCGEKVRSRRTFLALNKNFTIQIRSINTHFFGGAVDSVIRKRLHFGGRLSHS
jgi:hypothetical protein